MTRAVYPVVEFTLAQLSDRVPTPIVVEKARARLTGLLASLRDPAPPPDPARPGTEGNAGTRHALTCWVDEIFSLDEAWSTFWVDQTLEIEFYGTRLRAGDFWECAAMARNQAWGAVLEVYLLCVLLGFKGEWALDERRTWVHEVRTILGILDESTPVGVMGVPAGRPPTGELRGRVLVHKMLRMASFCAIIWLVVALAVALNHLAS